MIGESYRAKSTTEPRQADAVLTEDDLISCDLTLSPKMRLFVRPKPGAQVRAATAIALILLSCRNHRGRCAELS
jgi:hypothetical protein